MAQMKLYLIKLKNEISQFLSDKYDFCSMASAEEVRRTLLWTFLTAIVLYPLGPSIREIMPTICVPLLARYYYLDWHNSTLKRFKSKYLFYFFIIGLSIGVIFSTSVWDSLLHVLRHINKGFIYPFVAMECIRNIGDLKKIIYAFVIVGFWQGLNGVYQFMTGYDFIDNTPIMRGRLTGSMSTYRVGNYMALILIPALSLWYLIKVKVQSLKAALLCTLIFYPALFLMIFSLTRSAYLAFTAGIILHVLIHSKRIKWYYLLIPVVLAILLMIFSPQRFSMAAIIADGRWDLWRFAYEVFMQYPLTGAGFFQYNDAFRALGLVPRIDAITISHPHSIYIQLLAESGIIGAFFFFVFLFGSFIWGYIKISNGLKSTDKDIKLYWQLSSFFWAAWGAFLVNGIFGHDFFRLWWFSLATTLLGIMIGACLNAPVQKTVNNAPQKKAVHNAPQKKAVRNALWEKTVRNAKNN